MVKHYWLVLALIATYSISTWGNSAALPQPSAHIATDKWKTTAAAVLVARADANSLATAAALQYSVATANASKPATSALDLAARASELAPQDARIGWLYLQLCAGTPLCDIRDVATVMRWVDADNGAAWLQRLTAAQKDKDPLEVDRILTHMAQAARFDLYWNGIVVLMMDTLYSARDELPNGFAASDSTRLSAVNAIASVEIIPPFTALAEACRESGVQSERRELCLKLSKTMQRSDTVAAQIAGFNIEKHLLAPDSKEVRAIVERKHVLEWRVAAAAKFDNPLLPWTKNARARSRLARMRAIAREEDVCIAILREHKAALDPAEVHP